MLFWREGGISVERLTERIGSVVINVKYATQHETAIHRLAAIEDILGDSYDLDRLRELVESDRDGRCVVLPKDGMVYFHEESIDSGEKWVGNWPIKDVLLKCGFGIASLTYSIQDVGNKIYFDREDAEAALRRKQKGGRP